MFNKRNLLGVSALMLILIASIGSAGAEQEGTSLKLYEDTDQYQLLSRAVNVISPTDSNLARTQTSVIVHFYEGNCFGVMDDNPGILGPVFKYAYLMEGENKSQDLVDHVIYVMEMENSQALLLKYNNATAIRQELEKHAGEKEVVFDSSGSATAEEAFGLSPTPIRFGESGRVWESMFYPLEGRNVLRLIIGEDARGIAPENLPAAYDEAREYASANNLSYFESYTYDDFKSVTDMMQTGIDVQDRVGGSLLNWHRGVFYGGIKEIKMEDMKSV